MSPENRHILTPGPVHVPDLVFDAMRKPVIHQRSAPFLRFFSELQEGLRYLFQTEGPVFVLPATGSMAVEMTMRSLFQEGQVVAIQSNGKFSDRWLHYGTSLGLQILPLKSTWGESLTLENIQDTLKALPELSGMVLTHCETSTGAQIDLEEMAFAIRQARPDLIIIVDAMSTVGVVPLYTDDWELDAVISSSPKGIFCPAGVAFVAMRSQTTLLLDTPPTEDALHLGHYWRYLSMGSFPFTPPTQMLYGIAAALAYIQEVGLPARWNHSHQLSQYFKREVQALGGKLLGDANSDVLTAFSFGEEEDQDELRAQLYERGYELAGGQGKLAGEILRVGHFGWVDMQQLEGLIATLKDLRNA